LKLGIQNKFECSKKTRCKRLIKRLAAVPRPIILEPQQFTLPADKTLEVVLTSEQKLQYDSPLG
jgi:hypothetical protein